jgi:hypothetical protein
MGIYIASDYIAREIHDGVGAGDAAIGRLGNSDVQADVDTVAQRVGVRTDAMGGFY